MLIASQNNVVKYIGIFFVTSGVYTNVPQGLAWNGNNIGGSTKRGVGKRDQRAEPKKISETPSWLELFTLQVWRCT
jgi:hypothetical protein